MQVYPAASLINYVSAEVPVYFIDPNPAIRANDYANLTIIEDKAVMGMQKFVEILGAWIRTTFLILRQITFRQIQHFLFELDQRFPSFFPHRNLFYP